MKKLLVGHFRNLSHAPLIGKLIRGLAQFLSRAASSGKSYNDRARVKIADEKARADLKKELEQFGGRRPKISVIMPVYNPNPKFLAAAILSVVNQIYPDWELCLVDDHSSRKAVRKALKKWIQKDSRIKVIFSESHQGISRTTNQAVVLASGSYLVFMDHDDLLSPDALAKVALYFLKNPEADLVYSDNDKIDSFNYFYDPEFKPDWSPELLLSYMYFSHLTAVSKNLFEKVGGFCPEFDFVQDYDFALRAGELSRLVGHLPEVLYHWRAAPGSAALHSYQKKYAGAAQKSLEAALVRRNLKARVFQPDWARRGANSLFDLAFPAEGPAVTIVIFSQSKAGRSEPAVLNNCLASLAKTIYKNFRVENLSDWESGRNRAVQNISTEFVLFFDENLRIKNPEWLSQMMGYAQIKKVGAVGAKILNPDGTLSHAGVIIRQPGGRPEFIFQGRFSEDDYLFYARTTRNYSAVAGGCLLTKTKLFLKLGGFDEQNFSQELAEIDYCLRLNQLGHRCVYCSSAVLLKNDPEKKTPGYLKAAEFFNQKYAGYRDPYGNPMLK